MRFSGLVWDTLMKVKQSNQSRLAEGMKCQKRNWVQSTINKQWQVFNMVTCNLSFILHLQFCTVQENDMRLKLWALIVHTRFWYSCFGLWISKLAWPKHQIYLDSVVGKKDAKWTDLWQTMSLHVSLSTVKYRMQNGPPAKILPTYSQK